MEDMEKYAAELQAAKPSSELTLPQRAQLALKSEKAETELLALVKQSADIVAVLNVDGREQAHRMAMNLKNARVAIQKVGEEARADAVAYSKAVIAETARLTSLTEAEEKRVFALRDAFDSKVREEAAAKARAEKERVDAIHARIQDLRNAPLALIGCGSAVITEAIAKMQAVEITEELFGEPIFHGQAQAARDNAIETMRTSLVAAVAAEEMLAQQKKAAEEEAQRLAALAAENASLAAELKRQQEELAIAQKAAMDAALAEEARLAEEQRKADLVRFERAEAEAKARAEQEAASAAAAKAQQDELDRQREEQVAREKELADREAEYAAKVKAQAQADEDRKEAARVIAEKEALAEANRVAKANAKPVCSFTPTTIQVADVRQLPIPGLPELPPAPAPEPEAEPECATTSNFRIAATMLLKVRTAEEVIELLSDIIEELT